MPASAESIALEALTRALLNSTPLPLFGTKAKPGIFLGSTKGHKEAAILVETKKFIETTDLIEPKTKKPLYRVSQSGIAYAIENAEPVQLLREIKSGVDHLITLRGKIEATIRNLDQQQKVLDTLLSRMKTPVMAPAATVSPQSPSTPPQSKQMTWLGNAVEFVRTYEREHPTQYCPLPLLFDQVVKSTGSSIGAFHDGLRQLAQEGKLRLHPFTRPMYTIEREEYALVAGQEIKYYAQCLDGRTGY